MAWRSGVNDPYGQQYYGRGIRNFTPEPEPQLPRHSRYKGRGYGRGRGSHNYQRSPPPPGMHHTSAGHSVKRSQRQIPNELIQEHLDNLQAIWLDDRIKDKKAKSSAIYDKLKTILVEQSNPWEMAFSLFTTATDYPEGKTQSLSFQILLEFQKWVGSADNPYFGQQEEFLSQDLRVRVFHASAGKLMTYANVSFKAFFLRHPGNEYFLPLVKALLSKDKLVEAVHFASKLDLQSHFSQEEILIPLLLTDKVNLIESYIMGNPEQQLLILSLLDYLCARNTDLISFAQASGVKNVKGEKLSKKVLSKFAMRLMKIYNVPPESCPNISENRAMGTLRYLLYKRYIERSMGMESWDDMVESTIGMNPNLQQQFILELLGYNDISEAARWADYYDLPDCVLDPTVNAARKSLRENREQGFDESSVAGSSNIQEENWEEEAEEPSVYYTIPLSEDQIHIVDTRDKLQIAMERLTEPDSVIGIDAEWKPAMGTAVENVALLQLAVSDCVYLIDVVMLRSHLSSGEWGKIAENIFCDEKLLKIGYGLETDLRMLSKSFPSMKEPLQRMVRVVELEKVAQMVLFSNTSSTLDNPADLNEEDESEEGTEGTDHEQTQAMIRVVDKLEMVHKNEEKGLSLLVKKVLGKPLSKGEQMSNWEKRPLRPSQTHYAALDSYAVLKVYTTLLEQGLAKGLDPKDLEVPVLYKSKTRLDKKKDQATSANKKRQAKAKRLTFTHAVEDIRPRDFHVVCDSMLQGLGSQLRSCGIDTYILDGKQSHFDAIQIGLTENRIILTSGMPYDQICASVGESMCYCVSNKLRAKDQCLDVLQHFKVKVTKEDIFSRCAVCNSLDFIHMKSKDMEKLFMYNLQRKQLENTFQGAHSTDLSLFDVDQDTRNNFLQYQIDPATITFLNNGVKIKVEPIPKQDAFKTISEFFVCKTCGKVYWEGSHFERVCDQFKHILDMQTEQDRPDPANLLLDEFEEDEDDAGMEAFDMMATLQSAGFSGTWNITGSS